VIQFVVLSILAATVAVTTWVEIHEIVSEAKVLNPERAKGIALLVYQKGLRDFQPKVASAFAEGLASSGWRVEITTVSPHAPTDISMTHSVNDFLCPYYHSSNLEAFTKFCYYTSCHRVREFDDFVDKF
jgi:hypothetical protein